MKTKKHLTALAIAAASAGALAGGAAPASAAPNDAIIHNGGGLVMTVCRSLQNDTTCGNTTGRLNPGERTSTKFAWADADAIYAYPGCQVQVPGSPGPWINVGTLGQGWVKISGRFGFTVSARVKCEA